MSVQGKSKFPIPRIVPNPRAYRSSPSDFPPEARLLRDRGAHRVHFSRGSADDPRAGGGRGRRRKAERGEGGRAHTLRASPLPVYVRALHPATLRPPARPRDRPRYGIDRYRHPRTRSYGINGKMSGDALAPPRLTSPRAASRRVAPLHRGRVARRRRRRRRLRRR